MTASADVSIVIPVYNDADRLALCLEALAKQTVDLQSVEVLVVDNGSDEPPEGLVSRYGFCRLLRESKPGSYAARNRALQEACGSVVAFTDADCQPCTDWLERGLARLDAASRKAVIGGAIELFVADAKRPTLGELYDLAYGLQQENYTKLYHYAATANLITTREIIESVGPFNDDLKSSGDAEWGNRACAAGWPIVYAPDVVIRHPARRSLSDILVKARRHAGGRIDHLRTRSDRPSRWHQAKTLLRLVLPQVRHLIEGQRRLKNVGLAVRLRLAAATLLVQYAKLLEMIRTRLGGRSVRR